MVEKLAHEGKRRPITWRVVGWGFAGLLLLLPLAAMQFTDEVNWTISDFIQAAVLIGAVGAAFEWTVRATPNTAYRLGVGFALLAALLTIWANGAVGMIGSEDNPLNIMFFGVLALALLGAALVRFQAKGLAGVMIAAAVVQLLASAFGLSTDVRGAIFSATFAALWLLSAKFFSEAAKKGANLPSVPQALPPEPTASVPVAAVVSAFKTCHSVAANWTFSVLPMLVLMCIILALRPAAGAQVSVGH